MAFAMIQHLDPTHESQLPAVLSRFTALPVTVATDGLRVEPDHIYVIPSHADLTIGGGAFTLTVRVPGERHMPIDLFFRSLAQEQGARAIGVVLSGTGSDGTLGLRAIKEEGGLTFAQDEKSAAHAGMPQSAAAVADSVLPPEAIARDLARIADHPYVNHDGLSAPEPGQPEDENESHISSVLRILRTALGVDFAQYKPASVRRRIARRMLLQKIGDLETYVRHLRQTPGEAQALYDDLLIQVTGFFRDPQGVEALRLHVFPSLIKERAADEPIRIWVAGCATGEEAYSLVICLKEFLGEQDSTLPIQMFATDLGAAAVARARAGMFPASIEGEVSPERLRRFFVKTDGRYQISKAIRDVCVFAPQDLTKDPPFSRIDLISCCNVLIYLGAALQERVMPVLHYALKPAGFLKLGSSESIGRFTNLFSVIDKGHRIFARKPGPSVHLGFGLTIRDRTAAPAGAPNEIWSVAAIEKESDRLILGRYAPAGVVVNADMEIVQFRGKTGPYLEAMPGAASLNLFKMAREGLSAALRHAVQQAAKRGGVVKVESVRVRTNREMREVGLEVIPFGPADAAKRSHYLILFVEVDRGPALSKAAQGRGPRPKTALNRHVAQLTQELADAHRHLRATSEEQEAAVEELRAATEEAQSSNEELQSTNEELETAKEELQATNEELTTVNDELNSRNLELRQLSDDLGNLLTSTHVPIIMVDTDLRVRRMTPVSERVLNLAPSDVGRPIGDLRLSVDVPDLEAVIRGVIETLTVREAEAQARDGRWYSGRVRPYRTADNRIDGAVLSFVDIDVVKRGLEQAKAARDEAEAIVATVREPLVILDDGLRVVTANRSFYEVFHVTPEETEKRPIYELGNGQWDIPRLRTLLEETLTRDHAIEDFEVAHDFEPIGRRMMLLNARRVLSAPDHAGMILLAIDDITERKRLEAARATVLEREQAVRVEAEAASLAKDSFLAVLSHELRTPLNAMLGWIRILRGQKVDQTVAARGLEVIERNTVVQARLIEDLLDVSRIVSGTLHLDVRPVMVASAVEAALMAMRPVAEAKGIVMQSTLDEQAGPVRGDPARLQQIVWNLVANAIKFTPSGGRVDVRLARQGPAVELSVRDTGRGITAERLPQIFGPFGTAHSTTQSQGGLGLGLTIVRHLAERHGGSVRVASDGPGQGATFTVTLPVTHEPLPGESKAHGISAGDLASGTVPALDGVRVLVVDDDADTRELIRMILGRYGAEVTVVATAGAALEALEQAPPDVLVSDIAMPEDDGYDLIRKVRALDAGRGGRTPALALTALARIEDQARAIAAGYQQHAAKPIDPADLAAAVATLAGRGERPRPS